jgi:hypothetical protein
MARARARPVAEIVTLTSLYPTWCGPGASSVGTQTEEGVRK